MLVLLLVWVFFLVCQALQFCCWLQTYVFASYYYLNKIVWGWCWEGRGGSIYIWPCVKIFLIHVTVLIIMENSETWLILSLQGYNSWIAFQCAIAKLFPLLYVGKAEETERKIYEAFCFCFIIFSHHYIN